MTAAARRSCASSLEIFTHSFPHWLLPKTGSLERGPRACLSAIAHAFGWPPVHLYRVRDHGGKRRRWPACSQRAPKCEQDTIFRRAVPLNRKGASIAAVTNLERNFYEGINLSFTEELQWQRLTSVEENHFTDLSRRAVRITVYHPKRSIRANTA